MIEALKSDEIVDKMGGRFKLCALIQRRLVQLMDGARPLVERQGRSDLELVIDEIMQGKITYEFDPTGDANPKKILPPAAKNRGS
jgi:DNA-directed RNA polymerase subunit omega